MEKRGEDELWLQEAEQRNSGEMTELQRTLQACGRSPRVGHCSYQDSW